MKYVVVTGASSGIGQAIAEYLSAKGWHVFAGVRDLSDTNDHRVGSGPITPVLLDVIKDEQIADAVKTVSDALGGTKLCGLVNNAGIAQMGPLALQEMDDIKAHFAVNTFGLLAASKAFMPLLGMDEARSGEPGRIVNITSVGGRIASPFLGAYTATKHAAESITDSLRREMKVYGIDAIAVGPGSVKTPIWSKAEEKNNDNPYAGTAWEASIDAFSDAMMKGGEDGLEPEEVAEVVFAALSESSPKARYAPVPNKLTNFTIPTRLPKRWLDAIFWKRFKIERRKG